MKKLFNIFLLIIVSIGLSLSLSVSSAFASISLISVATDGTQGNSQSLYSTISSDGRYVVFYSDATNLVPNDTNNNNDIFLRDTLNNTTTLISVSTDGTQGNSYNGNSSVSSDGRYVSFQSNSSNLVENDTNNQSDVFLRDTLNNTTTRISVATDGTQGDDSSDIPTISSDGRYVVFGSSSTNLVPNDTNGNWDVFLRDIVNNTTTRISVATDGTQGDGNCGEYSISPDGNFVVYYSGSTNLVDGDTNGKNDVFVYNILTHTTTRVNLSSNGTQADDRTSDLPFIASGGRYVSFDSLATNLVEDDTNGYYDAFLRDTVNNITTRVSVATDGTQGNGDSESPMVSDDGRYVVFYSNATNLVPNDTNGNWDVFVRDTVNNITARVNVSEDGTEGNNESGIYYKSISGDSQYITFYSDATNLVPNDTNGQQDVFLVTNPLYTPIVTPPSSHTSHTGSSGYASAAMLATFQAEQEARAKAVGITWPSTLPTEYPSDIQAGKPTNITPPTTTPNINRTLKYKMTGEDVKQLQVYLNTHGYIISQTGNGSPNNETTYFGLKTKQAVIKFQIANGLVGDGVVGPKTREFIK